MEIIETNDLKISEKTRCDVTVKEVDTTSTTLVDERGRNLNKFIRLRVRYIFMYVVHGQ